MSKRLKAFFKIFRTPKLTSGQPDLRGSFASIDGSAEEQARRHNEVEIARANYEVTKEAFQKNLNLAYGALITSILAVLVATLALIVTAFKK
jgi:hypothetical protein